MKTVCLLILVCQWMQLSAMFIPETKNDNTILTQLNELKNEIDSLKTNLRNSNHDHEQEISQLKQRLDKCETKEGRIQQESYFIAFTAYAEEHRSYENGEIVQFDNALTNYGQYYNTQNSSFNCPFSGYYSFMVNMLADTGAKIRAEMMLDDTALLKAYAGDLDLHGSTSNQVVIYCESGQSVWIRALVYTNDPGEVVKMFGSRYSTFSGTLLRLA